MKSRRGFTVVEVVIAIVVMSVGLLGLVTASAMVTRMIARGQRTAKGSTWGARRLEILRTTGCSSQAAGYDTLYTQSHVAVATNSWMFTNTTQGNAWTVVDTVSYQTAQGKWRKDVLETEVSCRF
jgi:prepilin-type N-terminal cleavage/methylation domain-containing protein